MARVPQKTPHTVLAVRSAAGSSDSAVINIALDSERKAFLSAFESKSEAGQNSDLTRLLAQGDATRSYPSETAYTFWIIVLDRMLATAKSEPLQKRIRTILSDGHFSRPDGRSVSIRPQAARGFNFLFVYGAVDTMRRRLGPAFPYLLRYFIDPQPGGEGTIVRHNMEIGTEDVLNPSLQLSPGHYIKSRITLFYAEIAFVFQRISELRTDRLVLEHGTAYIQALIDVLEELINGRRADVVLYTIKEHDSEPVKAAKMKAKEAELGLYSTLRPRRPTDVSTLQGAYDRLFNRTDGIITRFLAPDSGKAAVGTGDMGASSSAPPPPSKALRKEPPKVSRDVASSLADTLRRRLVVTDESSVPPVVPSVSSVVPSAPPPPKTSDSRKAPPPRRRVVTLKEVKRDRHVPLVVSEEVPMSSRPPVLPSADVFSDSPKVVVDTAPPSSGAVEEGGSTEVPTDEFPSGLLGDESRMLDAELHAMPKTELPDTESMLRARIDELERELAKKEGLASESDDIGRQLHKFEDQVQADHKELDTLSDQYLRLQESLRETIEAKDQELQKISEQLEQKEEELLRRDEENTSLREELSGAEAQKSSASGPLVEDGETAELTQKISQLQSDLEAAEGDREALKSELEELNEKKKDTEDEIGMLRGKLSEADAASKEAQAENDGLQQEIDGLRSKLQLAEEKRLQEEAERAKTLDEELGRVRNESKEKGREVLSLKKELEGVRSKASGDERDKTLALEELQKKAHEAEDSAKQLRSLQEEKKSESSELHRNLEALQNEKEDLARELAKLHQELERLHKRGQDAAGLGKLQEKLDTQQRLLAEKEGLLRKREATLQDVREREKTVHEAEENLRRRQDSAKKELQHMQLQIETTKGLQRKLLEEARAAERELAKTRQDAASEKEKIDATMTALQDRRRFLEADITRLEGKAARDAMADRSRDRRGLEEAQAENKRLRQELEAALARATRPSTAEVVAARKRLEEDVGLAVPGALNTLSRQLDRLTSMQAELTRLKSDFKRSPYGVQLLELVTTLQKNLDTWISRWKALYERHDDDGDAAPPA